MAHEIDNLKISHFIHLQDSFSCSVNSRIFQSRITRNSQAVKRAFPHIYTNTL